MIIVLRHIPCPENKKISLQGQKIIKNNYSPEEENLIILMKKQGCTYAQIAKATNRTYWGIADKIRRLKQ